MSKGPNYIRIEGICQGSNEFYHQKAGKSMKEVERLFNTYRAAPELLEALETICDQVTDLTFEQLCLVKNAIRKARGGSNE